MPFPRASAIQLLILLSCLLPLTAVAQKGEVIAWQEGYKLNWADYRGVPDPANAAAASTSTFLGIEFQLTNNSLSYTITCHFSKDKSWGRMQNDYLLAHEQGHFDIAEIYARKLYKKMKSYVFNKDTYQADLRNIYQSVLDEKEETQNTYDRETNHSINREKQAEWLKKIAAMLKELAAFAEY